MAVEANRCGLKATNVDFKSLKKNFKLSINIFWLCPSLPG